MRSLRDEIAAVAADTEEIAEAALKLIKVEYEDLPIVAGPEDAIKPGAPLIHPAPLDADGRIDAELWRKHREHCGVRRFWEGEDDEIGRLVHKPGGAEHARWVFDYDETAEDDDEAGYRFGDHRFRNGEYVSIRDEDGEMHTFRVASVESAT